MEIKFRYIDEDYIEFNKFYNEYLGLNKRDRLANSILLPGILFFAISNYSGITRSVFYDTIFDLDNMYYNLDCF